MKPRTRSACVPAPRRGVGGRAHRLHRAQQAGHDQVFLLAVVVGEAVGGQADAARDVGDHAALHAVLVEHPGGAVQDGFALVAKARGGLAHAAVAARPRLPRRAAAAMGMTARCRWQATVRPPAISVKFGTFSAADVHRLRTARMEAAAGGHHAGHLAQQHLALAPGFGIGVGHRHRRQQCPGIGMQRLAEQRVAVGHLDDAAQVHHRDAVADVAHHGQVVRDEEIGQAQPLLQVHQHVHHLRLDRHVEGRDRLVADHQAGLQRQRPRDRDALALPAGELVRIALAPCRAAGPRWPAARPRARRTRRGWT